MKKKIGILCILLIIFIVGFLLYFSNGSIPVFNKGNVSLEDYYHSIKADFHYLKEEYTKEVDNTGDYPVLTLSKGDNSISITFIENYSNAIEKDMYVYKDNEAYKDFKEVKYSKYKGYSYNFKDEYTYVMLILDCEDGRLSKDSCYSLEATIKGDFNSEIEDILKSTSFSKNYSGALNFKGVVSTNHKFGIKDFEIEGYVVSIYKVGNGINIEISNEENKFLGIIEEGLTAAEGSSIIGEYTLHDLEKDSDLDAYSKLHVGNFNKGLDFAYEFYSNDIEEELYNQFVINILDNLETIK